MCKYKLYFMVRARIVEGQDIECADDTAAQDIADRRLALAGPAFDAVETWHGLRLVCRRERQPQRHGADLLAEVE
jgi:hypothetical protein